MHEHLLVTTPAETVIILKMLQQPAECSLKCFQGRALLEAWLPCHFLHVIFTISKSSQPFDFTARHTFMSLLCFRWSLCLSDGVGPLPVRFDVSSQLSLVDEESVYLVSACESVLLFGLWLCTKKKTTFSSSACIHNNKLTTGELSAFLYLSFWKV